MRHARFLRGGLGVFFLGLVLSLAGCTHNHYYGPGVPICGPTPVAVPATVTNGAVCEVPTQVGGGSVVAQGAGRSTIVSGVPVYSGATTPRVVVSEPSSSSRFGRWQRASPDAGLATTRVEGAYNDTTTNR
ncbi:hypothetical protein V5E97_34600 [Singulisphaera sp. Ch08]|uniref:Lipoprotein n=1 Tax=Singulisphaera sp. Ch08 TaxID=3120278 RepID=A0AAU7CEC9_9BACT